MIAASVLFAAGAVYTSRAVKKAEKEYPPLGKFLEIRGERLHYLDLGGDGRPVLWIHGAHGSMYDFLLAMEGAREYSRDNGFRFIFFDRPGFGHSTRNLKEPLTIFDQAAILHEAAQNLGIEKPIIAGHSLGSAVAMSYAAVYPEEISGVLLMAPYLLPYDGPVNPIHYIPVVPLAGPLFMETLFLPVVRTFFADGFLEKVFEPDPVSDPYARMIKAMALRPDNYRANAEDIRIFGPGLYKLAELYPSLEVPVIAIHGKADRVAPYDSHVSFIRKNLGSLKEVIPLEETGHHPIFTEKNAVLSALERLREIS